MSALYCLLILGASITTSFFCAYAFPFLVRNARRFQLLDKPEARKIHKFPMPRLGGVAIIPALWLGCAFCLLMAQASDLAPSSLSVGEFGAIIVGLLVGSSGGFLVGLYDDLKPIKAVAKLMGQILIAAVTVSFLPIPETVMGLAIPGWAWTSFAFGWLVIFPNSVNLLDGVDGLTGTLLAAFFFVLSILACTSGQVEWLGVFAPLMAALLIFLRYNWSPSSIFLGDAGSLSLGYSVAYLSLCFPFWPEFSRDFNPITLFALTSVWLIDTGAAIVRRYSRNLFLKSDLENPPRFWSRQKRALGSIVRPDKHHIHHWLLDRGFNPSTVVVIIVLAWLGVFLSCFPAMGLTRVLERLPPAVPYVTSGVGICLLLGVGFFIIMATKSKGDDQSAKLPSKERVA